MPPWTGRQPPCVPDPPPHATTGVRWASAMRSTSPTSSSVCGHTTMSGRAIGVPAAAAARAGQ